MKKFLLLGGLVTVIAMAIFMGCSQPAGETDALDEDSGKLPALTGSVSITGEKAVGKKLTAKTSALGGSGAIAYKWTNSKEGSAVIGTSPTYTVAEADNNSIIRVTVSRAGHSGVKNASVTIGVVEPTPVVTHAPDEPWLIGEQGPAGGTVFFVNDDPDTYRDWDYLEAAPHDVPGLFAWASNAFTSVRLDGDFSVDIGKGQKNTELILAANGDPDAPAAKAATGYELNGFTDWFLPSSGELNAMYENKAVITGDFADSFYWSSSQNQDVNDEAWYQRFDNGDIYYYGNKYGTHYVRPVRAFLATPEPTDSPEPDPTVSPTPSGSPTSTPSSTSTASPEPSPTPSSTPSGSPTASASPSASATPTATPSGSPTASATPTATPSGSPAASPTASASPTTTPSGTPTSTPSASATPTTTPTTASSIVGVTNITGVPTTVVKGGHYTLSSIVEPRNATNKTVVWTLNANGTGATINGAIINATAANMGSITATATIANGTNTGDYTQNFTISIVEVVDTVYTVAGVDIEMRSLPANTFVMGSTLDESSSTSMHVVTLSAFKMGKYEVTQEQFQAVMGYNPSDRGVSPDRPVHLISWSVAVAFCNKLSIAAGLQPVYDVPGITDWENFNYSHGSSIYYETALWSGATMDISKNGYRLPTEAEWDYAGRAGTTTEWINGNTVTAGLGLGAYAWYGENNASYTHHPVGGKLPNAFGLYDMQGSVYEWCWDWNGNYSSSPVTDPVGPESGVQFRITRGGSISAPASQLTSTYRLPTTLTTGMPQFGFRLVRR